MNNLAKLAFTVFLAGALTACTSSKPDRRGPPSNLQGGMMLKPAGLLFAGFDNDQSYSVSPAELSLGLDTAFRNADTDESGQLSLFEYQDWATRALGSATATPGWMELDRNGTNSIDPIEFRREFERLAQSYGLPSPSGLQLAALTLEMGERMASARSSNGRSGGPRSGGRPPRMQISPAPSMTAEN